MIASAIGSSNSTGVIFIYNWYGSGWQLTSRIAGNETSEAFGSSVQVLSPNGQYVAAGAPGFNQYAGVIRVYERSTASASYNLLGDIAGEPGDWLGAAGTLAGTASPHPVVWATTKSGLVKRYTLDSHTNSFIENGPLTATGLISPTLGMAPDSNHFVIGGNQIVDIYARV